MNVHEIMIPIKRVFVESSVSEAAKLMDSKNIGSLLVEDKDLTLGIITERDILTKIVARDIDPRKTPVREIMSNPLITIRPEQTIEEANLLIHTHKIRRVPVEREGKIIGIVTINGIARMLKYSLGQSLRDKEINYYRPSYGKNIITEK
jgi:CBS domain-containing protein